MSTYVRKANEALLRATLYINTGEPSDEDLGAIETLLDCISGGNAKAILSERQKEFLSLKDSNKMYFQKHPHDQIMVIGDCRIKSQILVGLFQSYGIERKNLKTFTDFEHLKKRFPFIDASSLVTKGILLGSIPHNVNGGGEYASPKQAIEALQGKNKFFFLAAPDLKITKEVIKDFIIGVSKSLQSKSP